MRRTIWHIGLYCQIQKDEYFLCYDVSACSYFGWFKSCSTKMDPVCDQIGNTLRSVHSSKVDGAICSLDLHGVSATARIVEIGNVTGTYDVKWSDLPYAVRKRGRTTGLRDGSVHDINYSGRTPDGWNFFGQLYIVASGWPFAEPGDSGSAVVDSNGRIVGLLWGGIGSIAAASPIADVLRELDIEVVTSAEPQLEVAYSETLAGQLEAALSATERGKAYWRAIDRNHSYIRHQFHATPRLYAIWQGIPQQAIADEIARAARDPEAVIPPSLDGEDTVVVVGRLRDAMRRYFTDADLVAQVESFHALIVNNIGRPWRPAMAEDAPIVDAV